MKGQIAGKKKREQQKGISEGYGERDRQNKKEGERKGRGGCQTV
jgi:hypothetical protein